MLHSCNHPLASTHRDRLAAEHPISVNDYLWCNRSAVPSKDLYGTLATLTLFYDDLILWAQTLQAPESLRDKSKFTCELEWKMSQFKSVNCLSMFISICSFPILRTTQSNSQMVKHFCPSQAFKQWSVSVPCYLFATFSTQQYIFNNFATD